MNLNSLVKDASEPDGPVQERWELSPPARPATSAVVPVSDQRPVAAHSAATTSARVARQCPYCTETVPPDARECPLCLREVADAVGEARRVVTTTTAVSGTRPATGAARANPLLAAAAVALAAPQVPVSQAAPNLSGVAVYTLESPAHCPECQAEINNIHVIRVLRTQVSFTSTLPRKAYVIVCPECRRLLSGGLSGLL
jgi:hypothetical protein